VLRPCKKHIRERPKKPRPKEARAPASTNNIVNLVYREVGG
jgi:hypothetical protein